MNEKQDLLRSQIEKAILQRQPGRAHIRILRFLQTSGNSGNAIFEACEWYRRLGLYHRGLSLLDLGKPFRSRVSLNTFDGKKLLWAARFLNAMGASTFAAKIIGQLEPATEFDFKILGGIYLSNYRFQDALQALMKMKDLDKDPQSYSSRLSRIALADAMAGTKNYLSAIQCAQEILERSQETLLQAICLQAIGEFHATDGNYENALKYLRQAESLSLKSDKTEDRGFLLKWLGYCHGKRGAAKEAEKYFALSESILFRPGVRAEVWLELLRFKNELGLLSNEESDRLYFYPGISEEFRTQLSHRDQAEFGDSGAKLAIDFTRDEYRIEQMTYLKLPLELRLVGHLAVAGNRGLAKIRVKNILWPDEPYAFWSLSSRLDQLIARIRKQYRLEINCAGEVLSLNSRALKQVFVLVGNEKSPSFIEKNGTFSASQFAANYNLKKTQASIYLEGLIDKEIISKTGVGRATKYLTK